MRALKVSHKKKLQILEHERDIHITFTMLSTKDIQLSTCGMIPQNFTFEFTPAKFILQSKSSGNKWKIYGDRSRSLYVLNIGI